MYKKNHELLSRSFDLFFSSLGLFILSPVFLMIAILIKLESKGPVFYCQERVGKNFRSFQIFKFRTMIQNADKKGPLITSGGDSRVTRIGRILRKTKIDELAQLLNVIKGDMSLVGPRPEVRKYVELYENEYKDILKVKPGITDIASIVYRDEESLLSMQADPETYYALIHLPKKIRLAKKYIENKSVLYDLRLILLTLRRILSSRRS